MNRQLLEDAINGLEQLKPVLQRMLIRTNYEGLSREDAQELGEHFDIALECMQKQLTGGWIPCKDRLPKTGNTIVLTQDKYGHIALAIYKDEKFYYLNQTNTTFIKGSVINGAIAWMPLPEPYKEG